MRITPPSRRTPTPGPVTLGGGESKLVAIAVGSNGLVSDAAYGGYTVGNVVEPVTLEDSALDTLVRELLRQDRGGHHHDRRAVGNQ